MKLSKNLSLAEVTKSITAKRLGIDNTPDEWVTENLKKVAESIELKRKVMKELKERGIL